MQQYPLKSNSDTPDVNRSAVMHSGAIWYPDSGGPARTRLGKSELSRSNLDRE